MINTYKPLITIKAKELLNGKSEEYIKAVEETVALVINAIEEKSWDGEHCGFCGKAYRDVWWTEDELWKDVTGWQNGDGTCCIPCFIRIARNKGISLSWKCEKLK
jgi:hypothetical protein